MDFDWKSIAGAVAPAAPQLAVVLGTSLGGPLGGLIGGIAGRAIASAFGVEATPEAVGAAIAKDNNAVEKLRILEESRGRQIVADAQVAIEKLKAEAQQADAVNASIQAETRAKVPWWHWRHLLGYVTMLLALVLVAAFAKVSFLGGDMAAFTNLVAQFTIIFGILATLNGYVASDTTSRYNAAAAAGDAGGGGSIGGLLKSILPAK